jgi:transposase-like protein
MKPKRFPDSIKTFAVFLYLNNVGIRKTALFLGVSPPTIVRWIKWAHKKFHKDFQPIQGQHLDIIEFDEIYTCIKKKPIE